MTLNERYQVHERLGEGGMALVYRATDLRLNRRVALKMLRPQYAGDPEFVERFEQEARSAAQLSHPNIAAVYDTGQDGETHYIVMELLKPFTLKDLIGRSPGGRLSADDAVRYAGQIAAALAHAHRRGVVHRDIKPQNILFTDDGLVKVTDFGIARALAATGGTATGTILGSPHYISPEQASAEPAGPASDIYSLGVVLYEMLTGRPPFSGETPVAIAVQHLREEPRPLLELAPDVPPRLERIVRRAMAKRPEERFESADALRLALEDEATPVPELAATTVLPAAPRPAAAEPAPTIYARRDERNGPSPLVWIALAVVVLGAVLGGMFLGARGPGEVTDPLATAVIEISGPQTVPAPSLIGLDVERAREWVTQDFASRGLQPPEVVEAPERLDSDKPRNEILEQTPRPGETMVEGGVIRVVLSSGVRQVTVPDVGQMTIERARRALEEAGLMLGRLSEEHSAQYVQGIVLRQKPEAGRQAPEGTGVDVVVSLGAPEPVPPPDPGDQPPPPEPAISIGEPAPVDGGLKEAKIVISLPTDSPPRRVELRWLAGGSGTQLAASLDPGQLFSEPIRGTAGAVLGVFVDGVEKGRVQY